MRCRVMLDNMFPPSNSLRRHSLTQKIRTLSLGITLGAGMMVLPMVQGSEETSVSSEDSHGPVAEIEGIVGRVTMADGQAIADAMVHPQSMDEPRNPIPEMVILTDEDGRFQWRLFPGQYTVTIVVDGYKTASKTIETKPRQAVELNFVLNPE